MVTKTDRGKDRDKKMWESIQSSETKRGRKNQGERDTERKRERG